MPGLIRSLRSRSLNAFGGAALLLVLAALAAAGLENVSFGHEHLAGGHALHHHHVYFGSHEHPGPDSRHDHEKAPHPHRGVPRRTATVSAGPVLAQPVAAGVLATPWTEAVLAAPPLAPAPVARPVVRLLPPRAPPLPRAVPRFLLQAA
jgi:hypothetical protein